MCSSVPCALILAVTMLVLSTTAASAQYWPGYEPYCPWCYQQRTAPVQQAPRRYRESRRVIHEAKNRVVPKQERHAMSVDEERASIKERVQSFCGRHPKDVACQTSTSAQPRQGESPKEP